MPKPIHTASFLRSRYNSCEAHLWAKRRKAKIILTKYTPTRAIVFYQNEA